MEKLAHSKLFAPMMLFTYNGSFGKGVTSVTFCLISHMFTHTFAIMIYEVDVPPCSILSYSPKGMINAVFLYLYF